MVPGAEVDACGLFRMLWKMIKFYIKWVKLIGNTNDKKKTTKKILGATGELSGKEFTIERWPEN